MTHPPSRAPQNPPPDSDEGTAATTTYTGSSYTGGSSSASRATPYSGSSGSYSYSYSGTRTGTVKGASTTASTDTLSAGPAQRPVAWAQQLPPRPPSRPVMVKASQIPPSNLSAHPNSKASTDSSGSYSYSYSDVSEESDGEGSDSYSYSEESGSESGSYSYSSASTLTRKDTDAAKGKPKVKNTDVTGSASSYSYSTTPSGYTGSTDYSYSTATGSSATASGTLATRSSGSYSSSYTPSRSSESYSYSYSYSGDQPTTSTASPRKWVSTSSSITQSGDGARRQGFSSGTTGSTTATTSQSYEYSRSSKDTSGSVPHRYSSSVSTESDESSDMSLTQSTGGSATTSSHSTRSTDTKRDDDDDDKRRRRRRGMPSPSTSTSSTTDPRRDTFVTMSMDASASTAAHSGLSATTSSVIRPRSSGDSRTAGGTSMQTESLDESRATASIVAPPPPPRPVVVLTTMPEETPTVAEMPAACIIARGSAPDVLSRLLDRVAAVQTAVAERRTARHAAAAAARSGSGKKQKSKSKGGDDKAHGGKSNAEDSATPTVHSVTTETAEHFTRRSLCFALRAIGVREAAERAAALREVSASLSRQAALALLEPFAHRAVVQRVAAAFHAHDRHGSGEVPLALAVDLLARCGLTRCEEESLSVAVEVAKGAARPTLRLSRRASAEDHANEDECAEASEPPPLERRAVEEVWDVCGAAADVRCDEQRGMVFVNRRAVYGTASPGGARAVAVQIAAMVHICRALDTCGVHDARGGCGVLYGPLLAGLFATPRSLLLANALGAISNPLGRADAWDARRRTEDAAKADRAKTSKRRKGGKAESDADGAEDAEALLPDTRRAERRGVEGVSLSTNDAAATAASAAGDVCCDVAIEKLRAPAVPDGARCYGLISARRSGAAEWAAAVEVPVRRVRASRHGGFSWDFEKDRHAVRFAGGRTDALYVEACYEVLEGGVPTTFCAGHALMDGVALRSGKASLLPGSLLPDEPNTAATTGGGANGDRTAPSSGRWWCGLPRRKATDTNGAKKGVFVVTLHVHRVSLRNAPSRVLALRRHVPILTQLRGAMHQSLHALSSAVGAEKASFHSAASSGSGAAAAVLMRREQQSKDCLAVANSTDAMDALTLLWDKTLRGTFGARPADETARRTALLALTEKVAAVRNCSIGGESVIAAAVTGTARVPFPLSSEAPLRPVCI